MTEQNKVKSRMIRCLIVPRDKDYGKALFTDNGDGSLIVDLEEYAIVPREEYENSAMEIRRKKFTTAFERGRNLGLEEAVKAMKKRVKQHKESYSAFDPVEAFEIAVSDIRALKREPK